MTASARISAGMLGELTAATDLVPVTGPLVWLKEIILTSGVGAGQIDQIYADRRTVNASSTDILDIATGGGLTSPLGTAIAMAEMVAIALYNPGAQALELTRPASNGVPWLKAAGDAIPIPPVGVQQLGTTSAGGLATVTADTGDLIHVTNGAGQAVTYEVVILGRSA